MQKRYIGTSAAARKFGVTTDTIRNWVKAGKLPANQTIGGQLRFDTRVINEMRAAKRNPAV
jgi:excisionase family DNA binding protein